MRRHEILRGESSGTIARNAGISQIALFNANPQLVKARDRFGHLDFAPEHFRVGGFINVPDPSDVVAQGQVGCGCGGGISPAAWRKVLSQDGTTAAPAAITLFPSIDQAVANTVAAVLGNRRRY